MGSSRLFKVTCCALSTFAAAVALAASPSRLPASSLPVTLEGTSFNPLAAQTGKVTVFIFVRTDCPICNRYAPIIQRLYEKYQSQDVNFFLVFPNPALSATEVRNYLKTYGYRCQILLDRGHFLVKRTGVQITPEAAVMSTSGNEIYHGRIDNWYVNFWTWRRTATVHDLDNAIQDALNGRLDSEKTASAVGCYISDLE